MFESPVILTVVAFAVLLVVTAIMAIAFRRVVPTNMVHIVQMAGKTVAYGRGKQVGNVYYAWPSWIPKIGVTVTEFPESIFDVALADYDAYDQARLPFVVDVTAFFRVDEAETAAQRVSSFAELRTQLNKVLQGSVRRILATNTLEQIMESRSELGEQFTSEVRNQIKEWGVQPVKTIEFMDLRDANGSNVIANIMAKEKSRIDRESRVSVAENNRQAQMAEIDAKRETDLHRVDAQQQTGVREANMEKNVGIEKERAQQDIQSEAAATAEKTMAVERVKRERGAEIVKSVQITEAQGAAEARRVEAEGALAATKFEAEGIEATGRAKAEAEKQLLLAPVEAQITLAKEIGENAGYQEYLVSLERISATKEIGKGMTAALEKAELKIISTGGSGGEPGELLSKTGSLLDMFSPQGGTKLTGMLAGLAATEEGQALVKRLTGAAKGEGGASSSLPLMEG